jgi:hypothetical protein
MGFFIRLLLAFAIAFAGCVAQVHSLAHALEDLAAAKQPLTAPSPLKHATDDCAVAHALDGTAAEAGTLPVAAEASHGLPPALSVRGGESPAAAFQSRAPPLHA